MEIQQWILARESFYMINICIIGSTIFYYASLTLFFDFQEKKFYILPTIGLSVVYSVVCFSLIYMNYIEEIEPHKYKTISNIQEKHTTSDTFNNALKMCLEDNKITNAEFYYLLDTLKNEEYLKNIEESKKLISIKKV